jgi:hypothetical protein
LKIAVLDLFNPYPALRQLDGGWQRAGGKIFVVLAEKGEKRQRFTGGSIFNFSFFFYDILNLVHSVDVHRM